MEYERSKTLIHIQRFVDMKWDALGESLVLFCEIGPADGQPAAQIAISVEPLAAAVLHAVLPQALADRPGEVGSRQ